MLDGRYRLLDRLGAGGMSVVWRAHDDVLGRDVAVKVLSPGLASDEEVLNRIRSEARSAARLRHPNVVQVHDYGETLDDDGVPLRYVVMELVDGRSLAQLLTAGALPWRLAVLICAQVAAALAAAHARGIVHRDVKPGNVMVTGSGAKLVDFGISATVGEVDGSDGQLLGTPAYLAPERLESGAVRPATDVYALGLLLYRMLAGHLPWQASTTTEMLVAHCYQEPADLPEIDGLPAEVVDLCHRCLAKRPADRPAAAEVAHLLGTAAGLVDPSVLLAGAGADGRWSDTFDDTTDAATEAVATDPAVTDPAVTGAASTGPAVTGPAVTGPVAVVPPVPPVAVVPRRQFPDRRLRDRRLLLTAAGAAALLVPAALLGLHERSQSADLRAQANGPVTAAACTVQYAIRSAAAGRSSTAVTIQNTGTVPVADWQLTFDVPAEQRLVRGWTDSWRQDGQVMQVHGGDLPAGGSVATGFDAAYPSVHAVPAQFRLNGSTCRSVLSVAGPTGGPATTPTTASTTTATTTATGVREPDDVPQPATAAGGGTPDDGNSGEKDDGNAGEKKVKKNSGKGKGKGSENKGKSKK